MDSNNPVQPPVVEEKAATKKERNPSDKILTLLKTIYDDCVQEDKAVRERQIRRWRRLKLLWEGYSRVWYSEVAHDYKIWDEQQDSESNSDQAYYDRPINVFRAYLESIIAALSVTVPAIKAYPEDATNSTDLETAKAGDKIAELMYRHNNVAILWLHALFICATEGMTAMYHYPHDSKDYGTYKEDQYEDVAEEINYVRCPLCGHQEEVPTEEFNAIDKTAQDTCPNCNNLHYPVFGQDSKVTSELKRTVIKPKTRVCMKPYGGLYVKIGNYAKCQKDLPYLILSDEFDKSLLIEKYWEDLKTDDDLYDILMDGDNQGAYDSYGMWGRLSPQYQSEIPRNILTENIAWIRPAKYNMLPKEDAALLKKKYPNGVRVVVISDKIICVKAECLDDYWTLTENPLADYLHFEPLGDSLTSVQDITNDLVSLTLQTIEHGIGQTFISPDIISTKAYAQTEATPGAIYPTKPLGSKKIADGIYEMKTATLSGEVLPFSTQIQTYGQLVSGATPSIFGGQLEGSGTASEYSMSRNQALQRLQNTWKIYTTWWKRVYEKTIPMFMDNMKDDEKDVKKNKDGSFINVTIQRSELTGKIGKVELEASENLPMTWGQRKDMLEKLMINAKPDSPIMQWINAPENLPVLHEYLGLVDFTVPGEDDVIQQYEEIKELLESEPIEQPGQIDPTTGMPGPPQNVPSVEIDPIYNNHGIHFEVIRKWVTSEEGRTAKVTNPPGYENVLLHGMQHLQQIQQAQMQQMQAQTAPAGDGANPAKANGNVNKQAPIEGENDIPAIH